MASQSSAGGEGGAEPADERNFGGERGRAAGVPGIVSISAGGYHTCAVLSDGDLYCWGLNGQNQLGSGAATHTCEPRRVPGLDNVVAVSAGPYHTCALTAEANLYCWGYDVEYQVGDGKSDLSSSPTAILGDVRTITTARNSSCATLLDGTIYCWGLNSVGEAGSETLEPVPAPAVVSMPTGARQVSAGWEHTCALLDDSAVYCWGANGSGELGDGTLAASPTPVRVLGLGGKPTAIAVGSHFSCALIDATVKCWGSNSWGRLGIDSTVDSSLSVSVSLDKAKAVELACAGRHCCVRYGDGTVSCWGNNAYGQLGNGSTEDAAKPVPVVGLASVTSVSVGCDGLNVTIDPPSDVVTSGHSCAVRSDGTARCWGRNQYGQLGNGATEDSPVPVEVIDLPSRP